MATLRGYYPGGSQLAYLIDSVAGTYTGWNGDGTVNVTRALTAAEVATCANIDAANSAAANQSTLQSRAQAALTANAVFLGLVSPTNAQVLAQVQLLTKENNALIKLALGLLSDTSGT